MRSFKTFQQPEEFARVGITKHIVALWHVRRCRYADLGNGVTEEALNTLARRIIPPRKCNASAGRQGSYALGDGKFRPATRLLGAYGQQGHLGRGVGFVDLDNDGRVDMVLNHMNESAAVLRNVAAKENHWLGVQLAGAGHADVVGARVVLEAGGRKQTRFAKGGGSYASSSDRRLVFGLGKTATQVVSIAGKLLERADNVLITRTTPAMAEHVLRELPEGEYGRHQRTVGRAARLYPRA